MAVSDSFRGFVLDQLGRVAAGIRARSMFGGVGIYAGDLFFALIARETLYLKVDGGTRADFEALGLRPFRPMGESGEVMSYYEVSAGILEDADELARWVSRAIDVARRARSRQARGGGRASRTGPG